MKSSGSVVGAFLLSKTEARAPRHKVLALRCPRRRDGAPQNLRNSRGWWRQLLPPNQLSRIMPAQNWRRKALVFRRGGRRELFQGYATFAFLFIKALV